MTEKYQIARSNDEFRANILNPKSDTQDRVALSFQFGLLPRKDIIGILQAVAKFDDFNEDNDPWGEHDFGKISTDWHEVFWKIDYLDVEQTSRTLTVMLVEEY